MSIGFWQILGVAGELAQKLTIAAADGKITLSEAVDMVGSIAQKFGLKMEIDLPVPKDLVDRAMSADVMGRYIAPPE